MPRTRSLAWSELKIGLVVALRARHGRRADLHGRAARAASSGSAIAQDRLRQRRGPEGRRAGACRRRRGRLGRRSRFRRRQVEVTLEVEQGACSRGSPIASIASLGSVSLLGEGGGRHHAPTAGHADSRMGLRAERAAPGSLPTVAEAGDQGPRADHGAAVRTSGREAARSASWSPTTRSTAVERSSSTSAEAVTRGINDGRGTLGRLANDPAAAKSLEASLAEPRDGDRSDPQRRGQPRPAPERRAFSKSLTSATTNLDAITGRSTRVKARQESW